MTKDSRGYSSLFLQQVKAGDRRSHVTAFALACIKRNIAISDVAFLMGVTRATVYNWFTGKTVPRDYYLTRMKTQLNKWKFRD